MVLGLLWKEFAAAGKCLTQLRYHFQAHLTLCVPIKHFYPPNGASIFATNTTRTKGARVLDTQRTPTQPSRHGGGQALCALTITLLY